MLNLDTHILLHALGGNLTSGEQALLKAQPWSISAIVLWEIAKLFQLGRILVDLKHPAFQSALDSIHVWPLSIEICDQSTHLDFRGDPADELIAATSIVHQIPLITRDERILGSRLVPFLRPE